jgi:hypothetical protein
MPNLSVISTHNIGIGCEVIQEVCARDFLIQAVRDEAAIANHLCSRIGAIQDLF